jgi:hypothetical protein
MYAVEVTCWPKKSTGVAGRGGQRDVHGHHHPSRVELRSLDVEKFNGCYLSAALAVKKPENIEPTT